ncbi:MAG TPA: NACHT domain-containing protein [Candidatus Limnocylindrales bacterium]|nr:NACHT domain-containing protein [Candidatus Limnocylindrales bacterium]
MPACLVYLMMKGHFGPFQTFLERFDQALKEAKPLKLQNCAIRPEFLSLLSLERLIEFHNLLEESPLASYLDRKIIQKLQAEIVYRGLVKIPRDFNVFKSFVQKQYPKDALTLSLDRLSQIVQTPTDWMQQEIAFLSELRQLRELGSRFEEVLTKILSTFWPETIQNKAVTHILFVRSKQLHNLVVENYVRPAIVRRIATIGNPAGEKIFATLSNLGEEFEETVQGIQFNLMSQNLLETRLEYEFDDSLISWTDFYGEGRSAGLAFAYLALAYQEPLYRNLGPYLACFGSYKDGIIGRVEQIREKVLAAKESGIRVLVIPEDNIPEIQNDREGCRVIKYRSGPVGEALNFVAQELTRLVDGLPEELKPVKGRHPFYQVGLKAGPGIVSWELVQERSRGFVGRKEEEEELLRFLIQQPRGYLFVEGDPGIGKSALLSQLIQDLLGEGDREGRPPDLLELVTGLGKQGLTLAFHLCYAGNRISIDVPRILSSLMQQLAVQGGQHTFIPPERSSHALLNLARAVVAQRKGKVLILIDGIDEALSVHPSHRHTAILETFLPGHLPDGVFILISARRGVLPTIPNPFIPSFRLELRGLPSESIHQLLFETLNRVGRPINLSSFSEKDIEAVRRVSAGNPLYIRMLAEDLIQGRLRMDGAHQLPLGVEGYFEDIFRRLCVNSRWATLRDCLLLLAVSRDYLSVDQVRAILDLSWIEAQEAIEGELQSILIKNTTTSEVLSYQLFHEKFREFLVNLFLGKLPEVVSRLNRHLVRQALRIPAMEAVLEPAHLTRVRQQLLTYCRRWRETGDAYPLLYLPGHLYETDAGEELEALLRKTDFLEVKLRRLADPFLAAEDIRYLTLVLLKGGRDQDVVELALTEKGFQRDGIVLALRGAGPNYTLQIHGIVNALITVQPSDLSPFQRMQFRWSRYFLSHPQVPASILNARRAAIKVAYSLGMDEVLVQAAQEDSQVVRVMLIPYLYHFWKERRDRGWHLIQHLCSRPRLSQPWNLWRLLETPIGVSIVILSYHFDEPEVVEQLKECWQANSRRLFHIPPDMGRLHKLWLQTFWGGLIFILTQILMRFLATQPEFQPINLVELKDAFLRPNPEYQKLVRVLECLEDPDSGFTQALEVLLSRNTSFDVYLMIALEWTFIYHGSRDPGGVLAALDRIHREGCSWFRQSALFVAFHTLDKARRVEDEWLETYARMTRETIRSTQATFQTAKRTYSLLPHMAWAEVVFDKHRPAGRARFIPEFLRDAIASGHIAYARRTILAGVVLSLIYRRHQLALDALRSALEVQDDRLQDLLINALANIRFYEQETVDRFLEHQDARELARRVASITPTILFGHIQNCFDEFFYHGIIHSDDFRTEVVGALRYRLQAQSPTQWLRHVVKRYVNAFLGEKLFPM